MKLFPTYLQRSKVNRIREKGMSYLFSILIPAYNAERYLEDALGSAVGQSFSDYEIVVANDGSTDSSLDIIINYSRKYDNISVLDGPNVGLLAVRRKLIREAKGEYVVFLDSDDALHQNALNVCEKAIKRTGADIVAFRYSCSADYKPNGTSRDMLEHGYYDGANYDLVKRHVCRGRFNNMWGKAIRRSCIDLEGDYQAYRGLMHGEDLLQILPIIDRSSSLVQLDDILYFYRQSDLASTSQFRIKQLDDIAAVLRCLFNYANKWGDQCVNEAAIGEIRQYIKLLKISELSTSSPSDRKTNFRAISSAMKVEGAFDRVRSSSLKIDNLILVKAIKYRMYYPAKFVISLVEMVKRRK